MIKQSLCEFVDAQEMARNHPDTFYAPNLDEEIPNLRVGKWIKVSTGNERFWCQITEINHAEGTVFCRVDKHLVCSEEHGLYYNDIISVTPNMFYDIAEF